MNWTNVGDLIAKVAPTLGGLVAGAGGEAVGALVAKILGADPNNPEQVFSRIQNDPQAGLKLLELQNNKEINLHQIALENYKVEVQDRDSARKLGVTDNTARNLAYCITAGFFICLFLIFYMALSPGEASDKDALMLLLGAITSKLNDVFHYFFGGTISTSVNNWKNPDNS